MKLFEILLTFKIIFSPFLKMLSEIHIHYIIIALTLVVLILSAVLVSKKRHAASTERFRVRASVMSGAASERMRQINPGFGPQLGTMEMAPPMANLTAQEGETPMFDFDIEGKNTYAGQLTDMALYLGQRGQLPYVKNLPM